MELIRDPDRLVHFLSGLHEDNINTDVRRHPPLDDPNDEVVHRVHLTARVLNALARLLVHKSGQVFAVGIVPPSLTRASARLIISEDSDHMSPRPPRTTLVISSKAFMLLGS